MVCYAQGKVSLKGAKHAEQNNQQQSASKGKDAQTINALLQLVHGHLVLPMHLVKKALIALMHVQLGLITAPHGGPQLAG